MQRVTRWEREMKCNLNLIFTWLVLFAVPGVALAHGDHSVPSAAAEHGVLAIPAVVFLCAVAVCALIANRYFARIVRANKQW